MNSIKIKFLSLSAILLSCLSIAACTKPTIVACPYPMPEVDELKTLVATEEKIVLNYPTNENAYSYNVYAYEVSLKHCSEFGKSSKLEYESTNESLHLLEFKCED